MRSEVIACKLPGQLISPVWLEKALETHNTCVGYALAKEGKVFHKNFDPADVDLKDAVEKTQEKFKAEHVFFYFMHADDPDKEYDLDSFQPFPILMKGDDTLLAVMLDGEFSAFEKEGPNTPAQHFLDDYLKPKITEMYADLGNLDKLLTRMDGAPFRKDLQTHLEPRGYMLALPARGKAFAISNNKLGGSYAWGLASNNLGIPSDVEGKESGPEVKVVDLVGTAKPLTFAEKKARQKALAAGTTTEDAPVSKEPPAPYYGKKIEEVVPKPNTPFHVGADGSLWCKPPIGSGHKEAKVFWSRHTRQPRPNNDNPRALYDGFPVTALAADSPFFHFLSEKDRPANPETSAFKEAHDIAQAKKEAQAKAKTEADNNPGILTTAEKQTLVNDRKDNALWGHTPEEIMTIATPKLKFSEQTQIPFEDLLHCSTSFLMRRNKRELVLIANEYRTKLFEAMKGGVKSTKAAERDEDNIQHEKVVTADTTKKPMSFAERKAAAKKQAA